MVSGMSCGLITHGVIRRWEGCRVAHSSTIDAATWSRDLCVRTRRVRESLVKGTGTLDTIDPPEAAVSMDSPEPEMSAESFTVRADGALADAQSAQTLVTSVLNMPPDGVAVVDLSAVNYFTMEAVGPFLQLVRRCVADGRALRLIASDAVRRKLETMGLASTFPLDSPVSLGGFGTAGDPAADVLARDPRPDGLASLVRADTPVLGELVHQDQATAPQVPEQ